MVKNKIPYPAVKFIIFGECNTRTIAKSSKTVKIFRALNILTDGYNIQLVNFSQINKSIRDVNPKKLLRLINFL